MSRLSKDSSERKLVSIEVIGSEESYAESVLSEVDLSEKGFEEVEFVQSLLSKVAARKSQWKWLTWQGVRLEDCDWTTARVQQGVFDESKIERCRMTGLEVFDSQFRGCRFEKCKFDLASLHETKWRDCRFVQCDLKAADFQGCELREVVFRHCDLRNVRLLGNRLRKIDLRGSQVDGLQVEAENLRHLTIDTSQVLYFASLSGIEVRELRDDESAFVGGSLFGQRAMASNAVLEQVEDEFDRSARIDVFAGEDLGAAVHIERTNAGEEDIDHAVVDERREFAAEALHTEAAANLYQGGALEIQSDVAHFGHIARVALAVCMEKPNDAAPAGFQTGEDAVPVTLVDWDGAFDDRQPVFDQVVDDLAGVVLRAVVDEDQFETDADLAEGLDEPQNCDAETGRLVVAGDGEGDLGCGAAIHVVLRIDGHESVTSETRVQKMPAGVALACDPTYWAASLPRNRV
ncbi:unnamed protein product [Cladocopium goreaui]|uniref:Pentapeptide repeat protein MfpA (Mycobacterial fluoroquinone resistance pentapeptide) (Orf3) n=1 Tax=Cladocopium goreaui TaxID=2562237 RepID=A0A9P1BEJ7_9DINO|nr:unnamed protein product [Cladocopium goreaui]